VHDSHGPAGGDCVFYDIPAKELRITAGRDRDAGQDPDGRGLACTVRPEEPEGFTFIYGKGDVVEGDESAEVFGQMGDLDRIHLYRNCWDW
jgi:hypothetical protein